MEEWRLIIGRLEIGDWRLKAGRLEVEDWKIGRLEGRWLEGRRWEDRRTMTGRLTDWRMIIESLEFDD